MNLQSFFHRRTLFFPANGKFPTLITNVNGKRRTRRMRCQTPERALAWSIRNRLTFLWYPYGTEKTLFLPAPGTVGVFVWTPQYTDRKRKRVKRFASAQAALAWCLGKCIAFVYLPQEEEPCLN